VSRAAVVPRDAGLSYARANILIGPGGDALALYRLAPASYPLLSDADKWRVQRRLERFAQVVQADYSLWRVFRANDPATYERVASEHSTAGTAAWHDLMATHRDAMTRSAGRTAEIYLGVSLEGARPANLAGALASGSERALSRIAALAGRSVNVAISDSRLVALAQAEQQLHERLSSAIELRRASTRELEWLLRRAPLRGVAEPDLDRLWAPDALVIEDEGGATYEPLGWDLWRLPAVVLREDPEHPPSLHLEIEQGEGFQALLCLGALADAPVFPGAAAELLRAPLDGLGFAVDAVMHVRWLGNREALGQVRKRIVDAEEVYRDQLESAHGPAWQADDDRTLAREYEQVLQSGTRPPMLYATISLAVGAMEREELERRVEQLRAAYGDVTLYRPRGLQERLYLDHLPRVDGGRVGEYVQQVTAEQFGAMVPTATTIIGDEQGLYVGYTVDGLRAPVLYDATAPSRESKASAVMLAGTLGSGKTVGAQLIGYGALRAGSRVVDFDPKPDHGWTAAPGIEEQVDVLELTGGPDQQGRLDPLVIGVGELREELTVSYLLELLRDPPASWERAITRAVRDVSQKAGRGTRAVVDRLRDVDGAGPEVADALDVLADVGLARLGFGDGTTDVASSGAMLTTIRAPGLTLPEPGVARETYSRAERISVATLSLVASLAVRLVCDDRAQHKVVILDECWFLLAASQGRALVNRLVRLARSFNATVVLSTQLVGDLSGIRDLVRTWFIFGQDSDTEAAQALRLIGVEPTAPATARLRQAEAGRCIMRDLHGRVAEVQLDVADPRLLVAFNTAPPTRSPVA
jgi:hypothetical protein